MLTVALPGVLPLAGETESQEPPEVAEALAEKVSVPPPDIEMERVCGCGVAPPTVKLTGDSVTGLTITVGPLAPPPPTTSVTGRVSVPDAVFTVTVPLYVPGNRPSAFTLMVTLPELLPCDGSNQFCPVVVVADTELTVVAKPLNVTWTVCAGALPPV